MMIIHFNMLIYSSGNISYYYQCWKFLTVKNPWLSLLINLMHRSLLNKNINFIKKKSYCPQHFEPLYTLLLCLLQNNSRLFLCHLSKASFPKRACELSEAPASNALCDWLVSSCIQMTRRKSSILHNYPLTFAYFST